jgi:hypothetical protein
MWGPGDLGTTAARSSLCRFGQCQGLQAWVCVLGWVGECMPRVGEGGLGPNPSCPGQANLGLRSLAGPAPEWWGGYRPRSHRGSAVGRDYFLGLLDTLGDAWPGSQRC